jgi:hypothetical protein
MLPEMVFMECSASRKIWRQFSLFRLKSQLLPVHPFGKAGFEPDMPLVSLPKTSQHDFGTLGGSIRLPHALRCPFSAWRLLAMTSALRWRWQRRPVLRRGEVVNR